MERAALYIGNSFKMYSNLRIDITLQNSRNVHSIAPYTADSASMEGKNKTKSTYLINEKSMGIELSTVF